MEIITGNYQLVYQSRGKCEIYRDTGVSKNNDKIYKDTKFNFSNLKHNRQLLFIVLILFIIRNVRYTKSF